MARLHFRINEEGRLDFFLRANLERKVQKEIGEIGGKFSASKIRRLIISGMVSVDARVVRRPAFFLKIHSTVTVVFFPKSFFYEKQINDKPFIMSKERILYEDENILAVDKAALIPTDEGYVSRISLTGELNAFLKKTRRSFSSFLFPIHRLDRETSGVVIFSKTKKAAAFYHSAFFEKKVQKFYRAFSEDKSCTNEIGSTITIEKFMARSSSKSARAKWSVTDRNGVYSRTDITFLARIKSDDRVFLEIEARPFTGRTHQIRVHLSNLNLPIVGDTLYGASPFRRILLHAHKIILPRMDGVGEISIISSFPADFTL